MAESATENDHESQHDEKPGPDQKRANRVRTLFERKLPTALDGFIRETLTNEPVENERAEKKRRRPNPRNKKQEPSFPDH